MENVYENAIEPTQEELEKSMQDSPETEDAVDLTATEDAKEAPKVDEPTVEVDGIKYPASLVRNALMQAKKHPYHMALPDEVAPPGRMLLCDFQLKHSKVGSSCPQYAVTPAEMVLLVADNHKEAGGNPITEFKMTHRTKRVAVHHRTQQADGTYRDILIRYEDRPTDQVATVARSPVDERDRLIRKYGEKRVKGLYPGAIPSLPTSFREALQLGLGATLDVNTLTGLPGSVADHKMDLS